MNEPKQTTSRRTLLQRGLLCVAGVFGLQLAPVEPSAAAPPPPLSGGRTLTLYSNGWRVRTPGQEAGKLPTRNGRLNRQTDLVEQPGGKRVGEFAATGFSPEGPGPVGAAGFHLEWHTLGLSDGTLFGIGSGPSGDGEKAHALLGGTGRYAGAKGTYVVHPCSGCGKEGVVKIVITFLA